MRGRLFRPGPSDARNYFDASVKYVTVRRPPPALWSVRARENGWLPMSFHLVIALSFAMAALAVWYVRFT